MKKMKKLGLIALAVLLVFSGCGKSVSNDGDSAKKVVLDLVYMSTYGAKDATIIKDQLEKVGIEVNLIQTPDYATYKEKVDSGNFDIAFTGWTTVTGNPDYAVRSIFVADGDYNISGIDDAELEKLILNASTQTPDQYVKTYAQVEQILMDNAYIVPLYSANKTQAYNKEVLVPGSEHVRLSKSRSMVWEQFDYNDTSLRGTLPLYLTQTNGDLTSLDPIKGNDGSINMLNTNQYIRLVNLTDEDAVTSEGALSYAFTIAEDNKAYYFILRDDVNFAMLKDGKAVDTGVRVSGEDVVYSMNRAKDKEAVPEHRTYTLHSSMETISVVSDIGELEAVVTADGSSVRSQLEAGVPQAIETLVTSRDEVNNGAGAYQVIKIETKEAFPQVLNFLAHQSAGIVSADQVAAINNATGTYGDQNEAVKDNHLYASGPYLMVGKDDRAIYFKKNPAYMTGTEHEPRIENVEVKIIPDSSAAVQALFSGEIHVLYSVPTLHFDRIQEDSKLNIVEMASNGAQYIVFNLDEAYGKATLDANLRKAVLNAIDPKPFIEIVHSGRAVEITSTVTPLLTNLEGYVPVKKPTDLTKAAEYLEAYGQ